MGGVVILGAGLAGLGCARTLAESHIYEAAAHPGGHAFSHLQDGVYFDQGAHISHSKDDAFVRMIQHAAPDVVEIPTSHVRNYRRGQWITYPVQNNLHELSVSERIAALGDLVAAHVASASGTPATNYDQWCRAQYGEYLTDNFYQLYTSKYWRVPMEELATDWLGGRLLPSQLQRIIAGAIAPQVEEQAAFARFRYPANGGFFGFFSSLYDDLDIHYSTAAVEIDAQSRRICFSDGTSQHYEAVASSVPLPLLVRMIKDAPTSIVQAADVLRATQLLCVNVIVNRSELSPCHWFYVYDTEIDISRVSIPSNLAPGSAPPGTTALQAEIFRRDDEPLDVDELVSQGLGQLGAMLNFDPQRDVRSVQHVLVPRAYIISDHKRGPAVEAITQWLATQDIYLMGLFGRWNYIWSDEAYRQGVQTAQLIHERCHAGLVSS